MIEGISMSHFQKHILGLRGGRVSAVVIVSIITSMSFASCRLRGPAARHADAVARLAALGLEQEGAFAILRDLTSVGPRLTGSPGASAGVEMARGIMEDLGFENVRLEPVTVNRWVRGEKEEAGVADERVAGRFPLAITALGNSVGTPPEGLVAPIVEVHSLKEMAGLKRDIEGSIVFFNRPMDRKRIDPGRAYGEAIDQRVRGASEAARYGAVAVLVRSLTFRKDDNPHTGMMTYDPAAPKIPAAAVSTADADRMNALLQENPRLKVRMKMDCRDLGPSPSFNVLGEIRGSELPGEIILVGGHLDSWDLGVGAHDDGAGCAASIEALRLIRESGLKPKRTIRAVMFMDEEFGGTGGRAYAAAEGRKGEIHISAIESDAGGFLPLGIATGSKKTSASIRKWLPLFEPLGIRWSRPGGGGVDVGPLSAGGTALLGIVTDSQRYFDAHHSALDVLAAVHPRELEIGAVAIAAYAYVLAQEGL
jgi:carboxypeptidase Q